MDVGGIFLGEEATHITPPCNKRSLMLPLKYK